MAADPSATLNTTQTANAASKTDTVSVLVLDTLAESVDGRAALAITSLIAEAISEHAGHEVLTLVDVKDVLSHEETKQLLGCADPSSCAQSVERLERVDLIVRPTAGRVGKDLVVSTALIDRRSAREKNRKSWVIEDESALKTRIHSLVSALFLWEGAESEVVFRLPNKANPSFAVLDLVPSGVPPEVVTNLTQILSAELEKIEGAQVIARDDIKALVTLEAQKQLLGCAGDTSCLAELGGALGVNYIVAGHVGTIAETYVVSLRLIAPEELSVKARVTESYAGQIAQLVGAVRHATRRLIGLETTQAGALALQTNDGDGTILLDGAAMDPPKSGPVTGLSAGRHSLRIVKDDFEEWSSDIYIDPGDPTALNVELTPSPEEWYESWIFWTSVAGAVAIAGGVGLGLAATQQGTTSSDPTHPFGLEVGLPSR